jgi:hypothetical protein
MEFIENRQAICGPFGDDTPLPNPVDVFQVSLDREGPSIYLHFDLPSYPKRPPEKWAKQGFNRVQVTLGLVDTADLVVSGWSTKQVGDIQIAKNSEGRLRVQFSSAQFNMTATAMTAFVQKVSGYCDGADAAPSRR